MKHDKVIASAVLALLVMTIPAQTFALHRVVVPRVRVAVAPPVFYFGPRLAYAGPRVVTVVPRNFGAVDFNVKPKNSRIYVDGGYLGIADDFDGWPQTAKLSVGNHSIRVIAPDGREEHRRIYVAGGQEFEFNLKFN